MTIDILELLGYHPIIQLHKTAMKEEKMVRRNALALSTCAVLALLLSSPAISQLAQTSWAKYQGDLGNTGRTSAIGAGGHLAWSSRAWYQVVAGAASVAADGTVYTPTGEGIRALNPNGSTRWTYNGGSAGGTPLVESDGTIYYVGYHAGSVRACAVNPDGSERWSREVGDFCDTPTIDNAGNLYLTTSTGIYTISAATGEYRWGKYLAYPTVGSPAIDSQGRIIVCTRFNGMYVLNSQGGVIGTSQPTPGLTLEAPAVGSDNTIYMGLYDYAGGHRLTAMNSAGAILWYNTDVGGGIVGSPAIGADGTVYAVCKDGSIRAYRNGALLWTYHSPQYGLANDGYSPLIDGAGTIYYSARSAATHGILALNPNGTLKWSTQTYNMGGGLSMGPQGQIYVNAGLIVQCFVPEPSSLVALLAGLGVVLTRVRRGA